jgi:hypothetical protein
MEFIYGLLTAAVLFLLLFLAYWLGTKQVKNKPPDIQAPKLTDTEAEELEKQAEKAKKIQAHFQRLMDYDVDQALKREYEGG